MMTTPFSSSTSSSWPHSSSSSSVPTSLATTTAYPLSASSPDGVISGGEADSSAPSHIPVES
jgi:hypothetical protein